MGNVSPPHVSIIVLKVSHLLFKCFCDSICLPHARLMYVREITPNCLIFPSKLGSSRVIPLGMLSSYGFPGYKTLSAVCITGKMEVIAIAIAIAIV